METITATAMPYPREPANYEEVAMQQSVLFADSLKDLKDLRKQLYSAAEYFESTYFNDNEKETVVNTLKDYAIKALLNTVDHLGSMTNKVNDLLVEKVDKVSETELRMSCIKQRLRSCQEHIDHEGLSQQQLQINTPKHHRRYIFPVGGALRGLDAEDDWSQFRNAVRATITETPPAVGNGSSSTPTPRLTQESRDLSLLKTESKRDLGSEKRTVSPHRFPLLRTASLARRSTTPKRSHSTTPKSSQPTTPNSSQPTTPNPRRLYPSEPLKSASMRLHTDRETHRDPQDQQPTGKSKRLLKALLSRRKSKKDETLYTYIDEY
ncbi:unnamed protein product [Cuscuta epithymum]|uniref:Uncharacterized protein n=1 Tax=Cuscuta epithymum TaxID=186058 RepID=A0AAV0EHW5_9ASTE|nr:unnamed protein product [Cuscuta epithymum]CAH9123453.1 unnamed protein product [Cuscuta epithymum]